MALLTNFEKYTQQKEQEEPPQEPQQETPETQEIWEQEEQEEQVEEYDDQESIIYSDDITEIVEYYEDLQLRAIYCNSDDEEILDDYRNELQYARTSNTIFI
jgi:hypothetical protein